MVSVNHHIIKISLTVCCLYISNTYSVLSQEIDDIIFTQSGQSIELKYYVSKNVGDEANITLYYSDDNGINYKLCKSVLGDVGNNIVLKRENTVTWLVTRDLENLTGNIKFRIEGGLHHEEKESKNKYFSLNYSIYPNNILDNTSGYGLLFGIIGNNGLGGDIKVIYQKAEYESEFSSIFSSNSYFVTIGLIKEILKTNNFALFGSVAGGVEINNSTYTSGGIISGDYNKIFFSMDAGIMININIINFEIRYTPSFSKIADIGDLKKMPGFATLGMGINF